MKFRVVVSAAVVVCAAVAAVSAAWAQHAQYYVLDAFGGVHAGGGAPAISPAPPYFGFDVAADIDYIPVGTNSSVGNGVIVLDDFGGVHPAGALVADPPLSPTPYFGFDAARAIVYRDVPTRGQWTANNSTTLTSTSYVAFASVTIVAPDDGFILVNATANIGCTFASGSATAQLNIGVDSTAGSAFLPNYIAGFSDCSDIPPGMSFASTPAALTHMRFVGAGPHTVNFLGRKLAGTINPWVVGGSLNVVFIDQDGKGDS